MRNTILVLVLLSSTIAIPFLPSLVPPNMRTTALLLLSLSAAASAIFLLPRFHSPDPPATVVVHSQGPTIEKLERLSQLGIPPRPSCRYSRGGRPGLPRKLVGKRRFANSRSTWAKPRSPIKARTPNRRRSSCRSRKYCNRVWTIAHPHLERGASGMVTLER